MARTSASRPDAAAPRPDPRPRHPPRRRRGGPRPARPLGAHLRARRPDAVAVGRRAAADDGHAARDAEAAARVRRAARRRTSSPAWASAPASRTPRSPRRCAAAAAELGFPLFEVPYEVPFIAITEKAFSHLVNEQYAVLQRALSAHERLERIVLSERGLDGVGGGARRADRRHRAGLRRARRAARARRRRRRRCADDVLAATGAELRERARARRAPRLRARPASCTAARSRCPWRARRRGGTATARRRRRGSSPPRTAAALAEFDRLVLHQAVTVVALELLRRRVADDTERRLAGDVLSAMVVAASSRAPSSRAGWSRSASASASACSCSRPPRAAQGAVVEDALSRGAARRGGRPAWSAGTGRSPARCCRSARADDDELFALAERVRARVARRRRARRSPPARAARSPPADLRRAFHEARCALEARALAGDARRQRRRHGRRGGSPPTATSAPSSCCSRSRTTTRCGCSATRSSRRSRRARAPTAAS